MVSYYGLMYSLYIYIKTVSQHVLANQYRHSTIKRLPLNKLPKTFSYIFSVLGIREAIGEREMEKFGNLKAIFSKTWNNSECQKSYNTETLNPGIIKTQSDKLIISMWLVLLSCKNIKTNCDATCNIMCHLEILSY